MTPIDFKPGTFYPLEWLETQLAGTVSLQQFLTVLDLQCTGRNRLFQNGLFGDEILQAIQSHLKANKAPQRADMAPCAPVLAPIPRKRGRPRKHPLRANVKNMS